MFGYKRTYRTIRTECFIGYLKERRIGYEVEQRACAENYRAADYLFGCGRFIHKRVHIARVLFKRAVKRYACKFCDSVGYRFNSVNVFKYLAYAFNRIVDIKFLTVGDKTLKRSFACVQRIDLCE